MIAGSIPDIVDFMDVHAVWVHAPTSVIFVCGGAIANDAEPPASLRDAFLRVTKTPAFDKFDIRRAELMPYLRPVGWYSELLKFERDIAQVSELILLFSESPGSLAELGAFAMDDEIAPKMLVVIDDESYNRTSFIRLGPIYSLMTDYGDNSVCVIKLSEHNIGNLSSCANIDLSTFSQFMRTQVLGRVKKTEKRGLIRDRHGHLIKVITGLIQYYASLTMTEILDLLSKMQLAVTEERTHQLLNCASLLGWIKIEKIGLNTFHSGVAENLALTFDLIDGVVPEFDRERWRGDIRVYWQLNDPDRFACIRAAVRSASQ